MARSKSSNTGKKLGTARGRAEGSKPTQFKKGYDPRRNLKGRPQSFDQFRALARDIAEQVATTATGTALKWNGQEITFAEFALLSWATDKKYLDKFVEAAYGKVPDESINYNFDIDEFIRQNLDLFTDGQIARLKAGENKAMIVAELMRETIQAKREK